MSAPTPSYRAVKTRVGARTQVRYVAVIRYPNGSVVTAPGKRKFYSAEDARAFAAARIDYLAQLYGYDQ